MTINAVFLDRDGVINVDHGYLYRAEDFEFIEGVFEACKTFQSQGFRIVIITNQSGIGRGYYSEHDFQQLTQWMIAQFKQRNIEILDVFYCPHHPDKAQTPYKLKCHCRKPEPGMLLAAQNKYDINMAKSIMVGDKSSDMKAASNAGVGKKYLVTSGQPFSEQTSTLADGVFSDLLAVSSALFPD